MTFSALSFQQFHSFRCASSTDAVRPVGFDIRGAAVLPAIYFVHATAPIFQVR